MMLIYKILGDIVINNDTTACENTRSSVWSLYEY